MSQEVAYTVVPSHADTSGQDFEVYLLALMFLRGIKSTEQFYLGSNVSGVGQFDDVVFIYRLKGEKMFHVTLAQLKHKLNPGRTRCTSISPELLSLTSKMSVPQYCLSYPKVQSWLKTSEICTAVKMAGMEVCVDSAELVLFTNKNLSTNSPRDSDTNKLLFTQGKVFWFTENKDSEMFKLFGELEEYCHLLKKADELAACSRNTEKTLENKSVKQKLKTFNSVLQKVQKWAEEWSGICSCWDKFLEKFRVYCSQSGLCELVGLIRDEIDEVCGTTGSNTEAICNELLKEIKEWWQSKTQNYFLTREAVFWIVMMKSQATKVSDAWLEKLRNLGIRFYDQETIKLREFVLENMAVQIVTDNTKGSTVLSALKIHQSLEDKSHLLLDNTTPQDCLREALALWGRWCNFLVMIGDEGDSLLGQLLDSRKLVILSSCERPDTCPAWHDEVKLDQLNIQSQLKALGTKVKFQGKDVSLSAITRDFEQLEDKLKASVLFSVLSSEDCVVCNPLPQDESFYISRKMGHQHSVSEELFRTDHVNVRFILSAESKEELRKFIPNDCNVLLFDEYMDSRERAQYIFVERQSQFNAIAELHKQVHWFHVENRNIIWRQSKGDTKILEGNLNEETFLIENVNSVEDIRSKVVVVSAEPGMGKSTLLTHLALDTIRAHPGMWMIRMDLNKYDCELNKLPENLEMHDAVKFILGASGVRTPWRCLFQSKLEMMDNVCVLFDGYDEIKNVHVNKVLRLFKLLQASNVHKLWITTRTTKRQDLEKNLCVLSFTLQPFSEEDKKEFLFKFWKSEIADISESVLNTFITELLKLTANNLNDKEKEFTAVPLQSLLLAEVFQEKLQNFRTTGDIELPKKFDILYLFRRFVGRKFDIFINKFKFNYHTEIQQLSETHMCAALLSLLPEEVINTLENNTILRNSQLLINKMKDGHRTVGIVKEISEGKPIFMHKTFSEYFAAMWFKSKFHNDVVRKLLETMLFDKNFQVVRNFLDRMLFEEDELHKTVYGHDLKSLKFLSIGANEVNQCDEGGRTALHIAVMNYLDSNVSIDLREDIVDFLLKHRGKPEVKDVVLGWRPLQYLDKIINIHFLGSIKYAPLTVVNLILQNGGTGNDLVYTKENLSDAEYLNLVLGTAIIKGLRQIVEFALDCGVKVDHFINLEKIFDSDDLVPLSLNLCEVAYRYNQLDITDCLVSRGLNVDQYHVTGFTTLQMACKDDKENYIEYLREKGADINICDSDYSTALHRAFNLGDQQFFSKLIDRGADINVPGNSGNTVLHKAATDGNLEKVEFFLSLRADPLRVNATGNNALHVAASEGHTELVALFLGTGMDCNILNTENGCTPLLCAMYGGHLETIKFLLEEGSDLNSCNKDGESALHIAVKYHDNADLVELLLNEGIFVNNEDDNGGHSTPYCW